MLNSVWLLLILKTRLRRDGFQAVWRWVGKRTKVVENTSTPCDAGEDTQLIEDITWAVNTVANKLPISCTCLPRAFATAILLKRSGVVPVLQIGVLKRAGTLQAHAWVEYSGSVIIGRVPNLSDFVRLPEWDETARVKITS